MALSGWYVREVSRKDIQGFLETHHYSHSINGCQTDFCYALYSPDGVMQGAMFFGKMAMANQWKRFTDEPEKVIELRRLACVDETPRNAESFFIGRSLRLLSKSWPGELVVSYADKEYGHTGTIYKASNFELVGTSPGAKVILWGDKRYHDKAIRTKNKGVLKPFALRLIAALKSGEAHYKKTAGKVVYQYRLRKTGA